MIEQKISLKQLGQYVAAGIVVLALLAGLGYGVKAIFHEITKERPHFTTGRIVMKDYEAAHYYDWMESRYIGQTCSGSDSSRTCTSVYIPVWHHDYVPDAWSIQIQNCNVLHKDGRQWVDKTGANRCFKKWIDVDQLAYNKVDVNGEWNG